MSQGGKFTPQHLLSYLQSIRSFAQFDASTSILHSQSNTDSASIHIRLTEQCHVPLHHFIADCIVVCRLHTDTTFRHDTRALESACTDLHLISSQQMQHLCTSSQSQSNDDDDVLSTFHNQFLFFVSILTQMMDESVVSTKLRIRGPFLLMSDTPCIRCLAQFVLSQLCFMETTLSASQYAMSMSQLKHLRYLLSFLRHVVQFELYTFEYLHLETVTKLLLHFSPPVENDGENDVENDVEIADASARTSMPPSSWARSLVRLLQVRLTVALPTNSLAVLRKFTKQKLILLEHKAVAASKAFQSSVIKFIRFLVLHCGSICGDSDSNSNQLDEMLEVFFTLVQSLSHGPGSHIDSIDSASGSQLQAREWLLQLWSVDELREDLTCAYQLRHTYKCSAFLKSQKQQQLQQPLAREVEEQDGDRDSIGVDSDVEMELESHDSLWSSLLSTSQEQTPAHDTESMSMATQNVANEQLHNNKLQHVFPADCNWTAMNATERVLFVQEQSYLLLAQMLLPTCLDFEVTVEILSSRRSKTVFHSVLELCSKMVVHFVRVEKWWHLSTVLSLVHDCWRHKSLFDGFLQYLHGDDCDRELETETSTLKDVAMNLKNAVHTLTIWLCYLHSFAPKPKICFYDEHRVEMSESEIIATTLPDIPRRVCELYIAKSVLVKLLTTPSTSEWWLRECASKFTHLRDQFALVRLLQILLHDIAFLRECNLFSCEDDRIQLRFVRLLQAFKQRISSRGHDQLASGMNEVRKPAAAQMSIKSKIVFRKQSMANPRNVRLIKVNKKLQLQNSVENDKNEPFLFRHFDAQSLKIVHCIVNNQKHVLAQFVSPSPQHRAPNNKAKAQFRAPNMPPAPTFKPLHKEISLPSSAGALNDGDGLGMDLSFLSSTLTSLQSALDVPDDGKREKEPHAQQTSEKHEYDAQSPPNPYTAYATTDDREDLEDFDFDFETLPNRNQKASNLPQTQKLFAAHTLLPPPRPSHCPPPQKKRKLQDKHDESPQMVQSAELTDLLNVLQNNI